MALNTPSISVVVTCYNHADQLSYALQSVLHQSLSNWECIIVNDGSPDHTEEVAMQWVVKDIRFKYIKQANGGLSSARNTGFEKANSLYIVPLDADDTLPNYALAKFIHVFTTKPEIDFIYGDYCLYDEKANENEIITCDKISQDQRLNIKKLLDNWILLGTSTCKKELWETINGYALKYSNTVQDVDFWMRALQNNANGYYLNEVIYIWNRSISGMNLTFNRTDYYKLLEEHFSFISKYTSKKKLIKKIAYGYYTNHSFKRLLQINFKYPYTVGILNHLRLPWLIIIKIKLFFKDDEKH